MMLHITLAETRRAGRVIDTATSQGVTAECRGGGAIHQLCRQLIELGIPDQSWEAYREGQRAMHGGSIQWMADHSTTDGDRAGLRVVRYVPFPGVR